jgi:hypothetical protein
MVVLISLLVAIVGMVVYAISVNPKAMELGRLAFWSGLLAFLLQVHSVVSLAR